LITAENAEIAETPRSLRSLRFILRAPLCRIGLLGRIGFGASVAAMRDESANASVKKVAAVVAAATLPDA
jgi:hypothetical protein